MDSVKGIILIATTHPYYGRMAYNLCMTIKATGTKVPVHLFWSGTALNHLSEDQRCLFDGLHEITQQAFAAKLHLYELSPFDETLYLDVDTAWLPKYKPEDLMNIDADYASITEGTNQDPHPKYYFWADWNEIKEVYGIQQIYQWRSEVVYFKKTERVARMFQVAQEVYAAPRLKTLHRFGEHIPDELAFNIACAKIGIEPHIYKWQPSYWPRLHGDGKTLDTVYYNYYLLSCGSNASSGYTRRIYDRTVAAAAYKLGKRHTFPLFDKKEFIKERIKM